jgi:hypothetical protein
VRLQAMECHPRLRAVQQRRRQDEECGAPALLNVLREARSGFWDFPMIPHQRASTAGMARRQAQDLVQGDIDETTVQEQHLLKSVGSPRALKP